MEEKNLIKIIETSRFARYINKDNANLDGAQEPEHALDFSQRVLDKIKERTNLDLSLGEDLSIALMNIISLEEHFLLSYMKTQDEKFLEFLEQTREARKRLLAKIVLKEKDDYSEKWCISKHLLSTSMRLMEVGTKYLHEGKKKEAQESFNDAFNFYSLFWAVNGIDKSDKNKKINPGKSKISQLIKKMLDCCRE